MTNKILLSLNPSLLTRNLYEAIIDAPLKAGADELLVVSGWVSPSFINVLRKGSGDKKVPLPNLPPEVKLEVVYGMYPTAGVTERDHEALVSLDQLAATKIHYFNPSKTYSPSNCHSKVYIWSKDGKPVQSFCGSLNATSSAFFSECREAITNCDPDSAFAYYRYIRDLSERCSELKGFLEREEIQAVVQLKTKTEKEFTLDTLERVTLPLTMYGKGLAIHQESGLNWGHRTKGPKRNSDQAYLPVPVGIARQRFFPPRGARFMLYTSDGDQFECAICQGGDKAIHSIESNAYIGAYFRRRLGLHSGVFVTLNDLKSYGRLDVDIYKLPSGDYLLDF